MFRAVSLVVVLLLSSIAAQAQTITLTGTETRVTTSPGDQYDAAIKGNLVVFTDYRTANSDVYYVDLLTLLEHPVMVAPGNQELTGVSNGNIVYTDYRTSDVALFNTIDGTTVNVTAADKVALGRAFNAVDPAISGNLVAWEDDRDGQMEIYAKNLVTNEERRLTTGTDIDEKPAVSGTVVVWQRCPVVGVACDIFSYDWTTDVTTRITDTAVCDERQPHISGQAVVYQSHCGTDYDVLEYNLATGIVMPLALAGDQANPHVSGDFVSFDDLSTGVYHINLWYVPSGQVFQITSGTAGQYLNSIDGTRVVYTDDRHGDLDIYMFEFEYSVIGGTPEQQITSLIDLVASLNLRRGIENSLDAKLNAALSALEAAREGAVGTACNVLAAFISEVQAQTGKAITAADAERLLAAAARVRAALGCS